MQSHELTDKYRYWAQPATAKNTDAVSQERPAENPPVVAPYKSAAMASTEPGTEYWLP